jgi:hypothetical protein
MVERSCHVAALVTLIAVLPPPIVAQTPQRADSAAPVVAIMSPRTPLPAEPASASVTRFSFIAYGDTRGRRDGVNEQYEHSLVVDAMIRTIRALERGPDPVRFVLQSGDAVVNGRDPRQWNVSFVGLINRVTTDGGVPYFLAPGNHDVTGSPDIANPGRQVGLGNYLRAVAQLIPPDRNARRLDGYPTYAFGYGNTFVLAFDSNIADDSTQFAWIERQLATLDKRRYENIVAFFHHPVFSSGPHGGSIVERPTAVLRSRYMPLFRKHGVDLLLAGHEHFFEHWVENYRDSTGRVRRIDQIVSGGGGAPLYPYLGEPDLRPYITSASADSVRVRHLVRPGMDPGDNPYHFLVVHVDGGRMWVEVVGIDWGRNYQPYRSARTTLSDSSATR